jgi:two-component system response regulator DesR
MIRILIAEDMHLIRGALVALLSLEDGMDVVAELDRGDEIVAAALRTRRTWPSWTSTCPGSTGSAPLGSCSCSCRGAGSWSSRG